MDTLKFSGDSRWWRKMDMASDAWRNARDRGNKRRERYWNKRMFYLAGRCTGMTHKMALVA